MFGSQVKLLAMISCVLRLEVVHLNEITVRCQMAGSVKILPLIVEYVSTAVDGEGRLYARHSSAQQLPRLVRTIFYGNTHKEIDISRLTTSSSGWGQSQISCPLDP